MDLYARNFSNIADLSEFSQSGHDNAMFQFAKALKSMAQENLIKYKIKQGLKERM